MPTERNTSLSFAVYHLDRLCSRQDSQADSERRVYDFELCLGA